MKAVLKNYRQSPRKVRLVANLIKGKDVATAEAQLSFLIKRSALPFSKLLASAVANAHQNFNIEKENLVVREVRVDKGIVMKRSMPRAMGRASRINKRSSHIVLVLAEKNAQKEKKAQKVVAEKIEKVAKPETKPKAKRVTKAKKAE